MSLTIREKFIKVNKSNSFSRVDCLHILDLYIGRNQNYNPTLLLLSTKKPFKIYSSQIIQVIFGYRDDKRWTISFSLEDKKFEGLFYKFCQDMIESSRILKQEENGADFICYRYNQWQKMLKKNGEGLLSLSEVKGLLGELIFLKDRLIPMYGDLKSLTSWIGPEAADQDFVCDDTWFEIKTTNSSSASIQISSLEQLDIKKVGDLVIIYLDETSITDFDRITINQMISEIEESLCSNNAKLIFSNKLLAFGYFKRLEYDNYNFKLISIDSYEVGSNFPALRKSDINEAITNVKYSISIASINEFKKDK